MSTQAQKIQKQITFPLQLYKLMEEKTKQFGISFTEYIRALAVKDIEETSTSYPFVDEETEKQIGKSLEDIKKGRYTTIKTAKELTAYLKSL